MRKLLLVLLFMTNMSYATDAWYNSDFVNRCKITFDVSLVSGTVTNFPVLVQLDSTTFSSYQSSNKITITSYTYINTTASESEWIGSYNSNRYICTGNKIHKINSSGVWVDTVTLSQAGDTIEGGTIDATNGYLYVGMWRGGLSRIYKINIGASFIEDSYMSATNSVADLYVSGGYLYAGIGSYSGTTEAGEGGILKIALSNFGTIYSSITLPSNAGNNSPQVQTDDGVYGYACCQHTTSSPSIVCQFKLDMTTYTLVTLGIGEGNAEVSNYYDGNVYIAGQDTVTAGGFLLKISSDNFHRENASKINFNASTQESSPTGAWARIGKYLYFPFVTTYGRIAEIDCDNFVYTRSFLMKYETADECLCYDSTEKKMFGVSGTGADNFKMWECDMSGVDCNANKQVCFTDNDGITLLPFEFEGTIVSSINFWVKIPSMTFNVAKYIYLYYNNSASTKIYENYYSVWSTNTVFLNHCYDDVYETNDIQQLRDSRCNVKYNNTYQTEKKLLNKPVETTGKVGMGQSFSSNDLNYLTTGYDVRSISAWVKWTGVNGSNQRITSFIKDTNNRSSILVSNGTDSKLYSDLKVGGTWRGIGWTATNLTTAWTHLYNIYDGINNKFYVNGVQVSNVACTYLYGNIANFTFRFGSYDGTTEWYAGLIDEIRFDTVARPPDYINTEYNSYNPGFMSLGTEETYSPSGTVKLLVVAGGGGGARTTGGGGGGGGAGGVRYTNAFTVTTQSYAVIVGTGGAGAISNGVNGGNGLYSSFGVSTATGGGGGGTRTGGTLNGLNGGSGGGGSCIGGVGGLGTGGEGYNGGAGNGDPNYYGGGGGGAKAVGGDAPTNTGGAGNYYEISGASVCYGGGGGGGGVAGRAAGGAGGGGAGDDSPNPGLPGTDGLGGGGGAGSGAISGGNGGLGVVIVSFKTDGTDGVDDTSSSTYGVKTTSGGYTIWTMYSDDTFVLVTTGGGSSPVKQIRRSSYGGIIE